MKTVAYTMKRLILLIILLTSAISLNCNNDNPQTESLNLAIAKLDSIAIDLNFESSIIRSITDDNLKLFNGLKLLPDSAITLWKVIERDCTKWNVSVQDSIFWNITERDCTLWIIKSEIFWTLSPVVELASGGRKVQVTWSPNSDPDLGGYKVYYQGAGRDIILDVGNVVYWEHTLPDTGLFEFCVSAYDTTGNESEKSKSCEYRVLN